MVVDFVTTARDWRHSSTAEEKYWQLEQRVERIKDRLSPGQVPISALVTVGSLPSFSRLLDAFAL